jgi:hypothetical protein
VVRCVPFGRSARSLATQLQQRVARVGLSAALNDAGSVDPEGDAHPDRRACRRGSDGFCRSCPATGLDPELELRAAARGFADEVRERQR